MISNFNHPYLFNLITYVDLRRLYKFIYVCEFMYLSIELKMNFPQDLKLFLNIPTIELS